MKARENKCKNSVLFENCSNQVIKLNTRKIREGEFSLFIVGGGSFKLAAIVIKKKKVVCKYNYVDINDTCIDTMFARIFFFVNGSVIQTPVHTSNCCQILHITMHFVPNRPFHSLFLEIGIFHSYRSSVEDSVDNFDDSKCISVVFIYFCHEYWQNRMLLIVLENVQKLLSNFVIRVVTRSRSSFFGEKKSQ